MPGCKLQAHHDVENAIPSDSNVAFTATSAAPWGEKRTAKKRVGLGYALATKVTFLENAPQNCVTLPKSARRSGCSLPVL